MTSYDDIWEAFVDNCQVDTSTLPQTDEGKYSLIHNGIRHYNVSTDISEIKLKYDDALEQINVDLDDARILILAYCIRYTVLENELIAFEQVWQPFIKEIGQKFYREQIFGRENTLVRTKQKIIELLTGIEDMSYLE
jgi:hypothetical protein